MKLSERLRELARKEGNAAYRGLIEGLAADAAALEKTQQPQAEIDYSSTDGKLWDNRVSAPLTGDDYSLLTKTRDTFEAAMQGRGVPVKLVPAKPNPVHPMTATAMSLCEALHRIANRWFLIEEDEAEQMAAVAKAAISEPIRFSPETDMGCLAAQLTARDEKWKAAIRNACGCEISFDPLGDEQDMLTPRPPTLNEFIASLKTPTDATDAPQH